MSDDGLVRATTPARRRDSSAICLRRSAADLAEPMPAADLRASSGAVVSCIRGAAVKAFGAAVGR